MLCSMDRKSHHAEQLQTMQQSCTHLETGSQGGDGPFFNTILKNLVHINSFPGLLMLRTTKKHVALFLHLFLFCFGLLFIVKI